MKAAIRTISDTPNIYEKRFLLLMKMIKNRSDA